MSALGDKLPRNFYQLTQDLTLEIKEIESAKCEGDEKYYEAAK